ncbi:MAG: site-specific integrase [Rhodospirillaceae bacterium]
MPRKNPGPRLKFREASGNWEIIYYYRGAIKRRSTGTGDHKEATRIFSEFLTASIVDKTPVGPKSPDERLIADVLADYVLEHGAHVIGKETLASSVKALLPFWDGRVVRDVREGTCRAYVAYRAQAGVGDQTAGRNLAVLNAAIKHDFNAGRLTMPVPSWRPPVPCGNERWLTRNEAAALIRAARRDPRSRWHLPLFILIGLYTGARKEAILSLRWPRIDLERGLIDLNPEGRERTKKGRPKLPIPRRLMTFLRYARRRGSDLGPVIHYNGRPLKDVWRGFSSAAKNAGLVDVVPHTLRHTAASWMVQRGVSFAVVARYLGHASSATTERVYAHHAPDYLAPARDALDNPFRR